jgi:hypothetical protein
MQETAMNRLTLVFKLHREYELHVNSDRIAVCPLAAAYIKLITIDY